MCRSLQHPGTQRRKQLKSKHISEINTKINSKWIKDLNIKSETIKLLEENMGRTLSNINHSKIFHDPSPRVMKTQINKWDPIKYKKLLNNEGNCKQGENTTSEWKKIIANETTDKALISKIYKQFMQLNTRKTKNPIKK